MLTVYGINVYYCFHIFWSDFLKLILTTEEVITATLKVISNTKVIMATEEVTTATISVTKQVILATNKLKCIEPLGLGTHLAQFLFVLFVLEAGHWGVLHGIPLVMNLFSFFGS